MKRLQTPACALLFCALLGADFGCKGKRGEDEASIQKRLEAKGTINLMDQVSKAPEYQPPADGRLTGRQVEIYLDVRRREQKIRQVALKNLKSKESQAKAEKRDVGLSEAMKAVGDLADVATADLRAAQELGYNPKEYSWIKERVLEAQMLQTTQALNQQMAENHRSLLKMLEDRLNAATDNAQRAEIQRQIDDIRDHASQAAADSDPVKEFNARLLARYKAELDRIQTEEQRISQGVESSSQGGRDGR
ncbi:MAG TPA: hypothetical protein VGX68_23250 [Thermoanaerobaculia bacterium]|jgi:hypothetical protein|nr:hypothetical protein [Thermoanaerobaculia bacterium]